ncbi:unnamed protein product [Mycena citricolor]|uniref:DNA 3'-5' helicase n=1 Tax=Mycena citricolor TaxID=2018698 RepID=A0AAD2H6S6_9AGAR|nr:unnamed protein product [Mycena citricolor]
MNEDLDKWHEASRSLLEEAHEKARKKSNYDAEKTRQELEELFEAHFQKPAHPFQIDFAEAMILGLDSILIAGTGAGKSITYMLPALHQCDKLVLIISPLKILQEDQVERFRALGMEAEAVNGDTWSEKLEKILMAQKLHAVLTSPEMCFKHDSFRKWLQSEATGQRVLGTVVDEAHCISQWGGAFRPDYSVLDKLRTIVPAGKPITALSATLNPNALKELVDGLNFDIDDTFFWNLGNDRPNITSSVVQMKSSKDYKAAANLLPDVTAVSTLKDVPKAIIFTDAIRKTQIICNRVRKRYPQLEKTSVAFLHAHRTVRAKRRIMEEFRAGNIKILVATEAAGMGADIPDIELIVQFGVPKSMSIWTQRAGRGGRDLQIQARAIMLVEKLMFQRKKAPSAKVSTSQVTHSKAKCSRAKQAKKSRKHGAVTTGPIPPPETESDSSSDLGSDLDSDAVPAHSEMAGQGADESAHETDEDEDGHVWAKAVDPDVCEYITTKACRRDIADKHFNNPPRRSPTSLCCDNCINAVSDSPPEDDSERPQTPLDQSPPSSVHSTPSKHTTANGKRRMTRAKKGEAPKTRRKEHLRSAKANLSDWRTITYLKEYADSNFTDIAILPDKVVNQLASNRALNMDELKALVPQWALADIHGQAIIDRLARLDQAYMDAVAGEKQAKKQKRAAEELRNATLQRPLMPISTNYPTPSTPAPSTASFAVHDLPVATPQGTFYQYMMPGHSPSGYVPVLSPYPTLLYQPSTPLLQTTTPDVFDS